MSHWSSPEASVCHHWQRAGSQSRVLHIWGSTSGRGRNTFFAIRLYRTGASSRMVGNSSNGNVSSIGLGTSRMPVFFREKAMNWARPGAILAIIVGAGMVSSLSDWLFAGDWIHRRYTYPEVWRQGGEGRAIALTSPLPFVTCAVFALVAARLGLHSVSSTLKLAVAVWAIGPLPLILTNAAFMKLHRVFVVCYLLGWLIKLMIVALAVGWFLPLRPVQ